MHCVGHNLHIVGFSIGNHLFVIVKTALVHTCLTQLLEMFVESMESESRMIFNFDENDLVVPSARTFHMSE